MTSLLIVLTVICGLLRACGSGTYKAMNECSPAFSNVYLNLICAGFAYFFAGQILRIIHKEGKFRPKRRDFLIAGLNSSMGAIVQGLIALAFLSGANVGGPEYVGQWIAISVVVIFTYYTQKRFPNFRQLFLIFSVAVGATFYITGDRVVAETNSLPSWIIISFACSILSGLCIATYNWWLEHTELGIGSAMMLSGGICIVISITIFGVSSQFDPNWSFPLSSDYWLYSALTVLFWVSAGIFATEVCLGKLLSSLRQSVTIGSQLVGAIFIGMIFYSDFPTLQQWPGIVITVGSIFLMVYKPPTNKVHHPK